MGINRNEVSVYRRVHGSKRNICSTEPELCRILEENIEDSLDYLKNQASVYETANWIIHRDRWIHNTSSSNTNNFNRGDIVTVELGAENYRFEPSYEHPAIVLVSRKLFSLIVPCSSQKHGKGFREIIDGGKDDGFRVDTGIQTESFRWISNNRIINKKGEVNSRILDELDKAILKMTPSYRKEKIEKDKKIEELERKISDLETQIALLSGKNEEKTVFQSENTCAS